MLLHIQGVSREAEYRTLLARDGELQFSSHDFRLLGEDGGEGEVWSCQHTFAKFPKCLEVVHTRAITD